MKQGFGPRWCQKNVALSCRQDVLELAEKNRWHDVIHTLHHLPKNLEDESLNQLHSLALFNLGSEQAEKNKWPQAIKYWEEAADKAHNRYLAQNLALALEKRGDWEAAAPIVEGYAAAQTPQNRSSGLFDREAGGDGVGAYL